MTPEPSKQLRDIAPPKVPDELMDEMHKANEQMKDDRVKLEAATTDGDYDQSEHVDDANKELRKTERKIEDIEAKVREAIQPASEGTHGK